MHKNAIWLSVWFALLLVLVATVLWRFVPREPPVEQLAATALRGATPEEQTTAAAQLAARGEPARLHLRKLMAESQNDNVRAIAMDALGGLLDYQSMDALFAAMEDESLLVRTRAGAAVGRIIGFDRRFDANSSPELRKQAIAQIHSDWEVVRKSEQFQSLMAQQAEEEPSHGTP